MSWSKRFELKAQRASYPAKATPEMRTAAVNAYRLSVGSPTIKGEAANAECVTPEADKTKLEGDVMEKIWKCKIGGIADELLPGSDLPMRQAVQDAFIRITGSRPSYCFSGWDANLTESERAVVENRLPVYEKTEYGMREADIASAREAGIREALAVISDQFCSADNDIEEARNLGATWCEEAVEALLTTPAVNPHKDDICVDSFAGVMKTKLAKKRRNGYAGWDNEEKCTPEFLAALLKHHLAKGDPVDIANFAMMLWHRKGGSEALKKTFSTPAVNPHIDAGTDDNWTPKTESTGE